MKIAGFYPDLELGYRYVWIRIRRFLLFSKPYLDPYKIWFTSWVQGFEQFDFVQYHLTWSYALYGSLIIYIKKKPDYQGHEPEPDPEYRPYINQ